MALAGLSGYRSWLASCEKEETTNLIMSRSHVECWSGFTGYSQEATC